jgi:hypothetical protein
MSMPWCGNEWAKSFLETFSCSCGFLPEQRLGPCADANSGCGYYGSSLNVDSHISSFLERLVFILMLSYLSLHDYNTILT